jgi:glyoxylase-like metal-dependent hydrolase (beta-lactamase superfamily II)
MRVMKPMGRLLVVTLVCAVAVTSRADGSDSPGPAAVTAGATPLSVEMFRGGFATVNSFIFSNGRSLIVMDVQRKSTEARKLAELVRSKQLPLTHVFISHGHTDHFTGVDVFQREFPGAKIVVANEAIRRDVKSYAIYMDSYGATAAEPVLEPALRPKSADNPDGFDYEQMIGVLSGDTLMLDGGGALEISTDYEPTEAPHMATVYSPDLNALFLADLGYNKVHLWLGDDITRERIANWRATLLRLEEQYRSRNPTVYPGHGEPTDMTMFGTMVRYIDDFLAVTLRARSREEAMAQMIAKYPDYAEADFFLKYSIENHVR